MSTPPLHIPLSVAFLCQDCNRVTNCGRRCPACASDAMLGLAAVLNREIKEESDPCPPSPTTASAN